MLSMIIAHCTRKALSLYSLQTKPRNEYSRVVLRHKAAVENLEQCQSHIFGMRTRKTNLPSGHLSYTLNGMLTPSSWL